ncbi:DEAD/DEAH box helicase [Akkermansiaceae bacterium]|nr:DEAD/DEAH box helicase [Akkermansiaceae bacterium]
MSEFGKLGIPADLVKGLQEMGIVTPTEVQAKAIPFLMKNGGDFCAQAQTGTGKTAAFGLPLLTKINPNKPEIQGLVIAPTRELAKQIAKQLFRYTKFSERIFVEALTGGEPMDIQIGRLKRPTHIVVATPGRLLDLLKKKALTLVNVKHLVLDEADEMLSMGFKKDLVAIFGLTRGRRSTWLFSATFPDSIHALVKGAMPGQPEMLTIDRAHVVNQNIDHRYAVCGKDEKNDFLAGFLGRRGEERGLVFVRTKAGAVALGRQLEKLGFPVDVIQGDLSQRERDKVMRGFKNGRSRILIATDVAARGIDVEGLSFVIHYQLPEDFDYYTHRSGRTARAGKKGTSIALIDPRERKKIGKFEEALGVTFSEMG